MEVEKNSVGLKEEEIVFLLLSLLSMMCSAMLLGNQ